MIRKYFINRKKWYNRNMKIWKVISLIVDHWNVLRNLKEVGKHNEIVIRRIYRWINNRMYWMI